MSFRTAFYVLDGLFLIGMLGYIVFRVLSIRRNPERDPANLTPFLEDDALEGRRLERVLGWSLLMSLIIAVSLPVYFIVEPSREATAKDAFLERSIERGAVLFANKQSPHYESEFSLLCADCHGVDGTGGSASFVLQPEADKCLKKQNQKRVDVPECLPRQVSWEAPNLTLAGLRYSRAQLTQIITYGRPGTPMPAWGVKSGKGAKDTQSIDDLVNYVESIKTTAEKAQKDAVDALATYKQDAADLPAQKQGELTTADADLAKAQADPAATDAEIAALQKVVTGLQADVAKAQAYAAEVAALPDEAILFRLNCARCHTKGWSYYVTDPARSDLPPLAPQGSGAYGPSLENETLQFPGEAGVQNQFNWVAIGVKANEQYGIRGISSGRMPHFGQVLTDAQIKAIVKYERSLGGGAAP